jgi:hypothetical protein
MKIDYGVSFPLNAFSCHLHSNSTCVILNLKQGIPTEKIDCILVLARYVCY